MHFFFTHVECGNRISNVEFDTISFMSLNYEITNHFSIVCTKTTLIANG